MKSTPLKWHGGKSYLAKWIISYFPKHTHYVEPYFGGGQVLFAKPVKWIKDHSEVINDINGELSNFWTCIGNELCFKGMLRRLSTKPFSEVEFLKAYNNNRKHWNNIDRAVAFFCRYRLSRQGLGRDFATLSRTRTRRGMNEQVSSWLSAIESLPEAHERLIRVAVLNQDAIQVIKSQDGPKTLFYLDPPYLPSTRSTNNTYEFEMTRKDHIKLLKIIRKVKGKVILSGYPSKLYRRRLHDWTVVKKKIDNKASSSKKKAKKVETLWMNFSL